MKYQIDTNRHVTSTVRYLKISPLNEKLEFQAGQYVEFVVSEKESIPFSIANAPKETGELEFFIREDASNLLQKKLMLYLSSQPTLTVQGPFGNCVYEKTKRKFVILLAGGIGISQIQSLVEQAIKSKDSRHFYLYWGISSLEDLFFESAFKRWKKALTHFNYQIESKSENLPIIKIVNDFNDLAQCDVYSSGPWQMTDKVFAAFSKHGLPKDQMHSDRFAFL